MRLFVAVDFPESCNLFLKKVQEGIKLPLKFTKDFHLTLLFIGEVEDDASVIESLRKVNFSEFELKFGKYGVFPNLKKPRVLWLGFEESKEILELQKSISKGLPGIKEDYPYSPHLTIARIPYIKEDIEKLLKDLPLPDETVKINCFKLYKSTLTPTGAVHEVVETFK